ncbi:PKD domain-containing protein [Candidatus Bathyarchaeota archaeon]|nr:MAG: PKD domain-containing protein [Candidatus Bathyarchaeota archaeon]
MFGILIASFAVSTDHDRRSYPAIQATPPGQASFDYIVVIVMNNASAKQVYGSSATPYLNSLASTYGYATAYSDVEAAVSDPNYLALIGASTFGLTADCYPTQCSVSDVSIVDSIEGAGLTWNAWAEDYPVSQGCSLLPSNAEYNSKHFPFLYFENIVNDPARCDNLLRANSVVTSSIETDDLFLKSLGSTSSAANYNWLTPNQCDDIHDCPLSTGDKYLSQLVPKILSSTVFTTQNAALFITFAESTGSSVGNVPAIWAGPVVKTKFQSSKSYNHYSVLTTLETAWGLPPLTSEDSSASAMTEFFKNLAPQTSLSYAPTHPVVGDSISFNSTATGGIPPYTFSWNFGESPSNVRGGTGLPNTMTHTYTKAGTYTVTVNATDTNGKIGSALATVTVAAPLTLTVSGSSSGIIGTSISFSAAASGGTSPYSFSWNFGDGTSLATGSTASHKYAVAGAYTVRANATDAKGRLASASASITINAPPLTVTVTASGSSEVGLAVNLMATASGGTQPYVSFIWDFGDASSGSGNSVAHVYTASGSYSVTVTVKDSAGITATSSSRSLAVSARLQVSSVHAVPNPTETGYSISLSATTSGGVSPVSCNWNLGDGSPPSFGCSITHVYAIAADYIATVTATDNLSVTATNSMTITVSPKLTVTVSTSTPNPVVGQSLTFTATTANGVGVATCSWNFGDGSTGSGCSKTHAYTTQGTFTVKVTATDTLIVTATASVTVDVVSTLGVSLNANPSTTESSVSISFTAAAAGGTPPYTSYSWTFGDGTTATTTVATTIHTYNSTGLFSVEVTVTDSAGKTAASSFSVTVNARLTVTAVATPNLTEVSVAVGFTAPTTGGLGTATCKWTFGDSGTANVCSASHTYTSAGTFTAIVTATDALGVTATNNTTITVSPKLTVTVTTSTSNSVVGQSLTFTTTPSGGVGTATCTWNFGDNTTGFGCSTTHTYTTSGTFAATVTATDILAVNATTSVTFNVGSALAVILVISANPTELAVSTTFTARATGGSPPFASYNWTFSDGTTATTTTATTNHIYNATGTFSAMVAVTDSTSVTAMSTAVSVAVNPRLSVTAVAGPNPTEMSKATSFTIMPAGGAGAIVCSWTFGDTTTGSGCLTTHTYAATGSFTANVTAIDGLGVTATSSVSLTVNAKLSVTVAASPNPAEVGSVIGFTAHATRGVGVATCNWTFGDGTTGTGCITTHAYASQGTFTASVTAADTVNVTATTDISVAVNAKLAVTSVASPRPTEVGKAVSFTSTPAGGVGTITCSWAFGDTTTGTGCSTTHAYANSGTFTAAVTATDSLGMNATASNTVAVNAKLAVTAYTSPNLAEVGALVDFTAPTTGGVGTATCSWAFGDGGTANICSASHTYITSGPFNPTVTVTDALSVTASSSVSVTVNARLTLTATAGPNPTDDGVRVGLAPVTASGVGAITCSWDFGDTAGATGCSTSHTYTGTGTFTATVTATDEVGVTTAASVTITVNSLPGVNFSFGPDKPMAGESVNFTTTTTGGSGPYSFNWNYGDGGSGSGNPANHSFVASGTFNVTVTVTDVVGETATVTHSVAVTQSLAVSITSITPSPSEIGVSTSYSATATGGTPTYMFSWDFGDGLQAIEGSQVAHTYTATGTFSVTISAADSANHTATATQTLVVNSRLAVTAAASPNPADAGVPVSFALVSTGGVGSLDCNWSFDDGWSASKCNTIHTYATTGSFTASLTATDTLGVAASISLQISVAVAPTVNFASSPAAPTTGQSVTFTATTNGGGSPFTFSWNYGDGSPDDNGSPATHTYAASGIFMVNLTINDANGANMVTTLFVSVVENRPPVFSSQSGFLPVSVGQSLTFTVAASDPEGGPVSIAAHNLPTGASFDSSTGEFVWTPSSDETGNYSITFTALDSGTPPMEVRQTIIIQVRAGTGQICLTCYRTFGLPLDDGVIASLGFLGLISALVAAIYVGMRGRGEPDSVSPATSNVSWEGAREDSLPGQNQFVEWMEDASS